MTRKIWRPVSWPIVLAGVCAPFIANCGGGLPGGLPGVPGAGKCPDMAQVDAIESFNFEQEFKLKADVAAKVKAGASAAASIKALGAKIEADLKGACTTLAHDLGGSGEYKDAKEACEAAMKVMGEVKAKMGANIKIALDVTEPKCAADINAYADCAGKCDVNVKGPKAEVKCEPGKLSGECSAKCKGECDMSASAACTGECNGSCDADIKGTCTGKCNGKCDGKAVDAKANGKCDGVCEGKCEGNVKAECKGKCGGNCKLSGEAECKGTCTGGCSAEMKAPKCNGKVEPPQMSADCKAKCDAGVSAKVSCTPPRITLKITGSADAAAEAKFRAAIEKDLGLIVNVAVGMAKQVATLKDEIQIVVDGAQAGISGADGMAKASLSACLAPVVGIADVMANIKANVNVSVNVQASASASGSAKAG